LLKSSKFGIQPLKGATDIEAFAASLKRCPDTPSFSANGEAANLEQLLPQR
jgi:hypothetical protein